MSDHLEKMLRHAESKLLGSGSESSADRLNLYRDFLKIEEYRLHLAHHAGDDGLVFCQNRAALIDAVLRHVWDVASDFTRREYGELYDENEVALVAVGGYGRSELCPFSDVDLLFLHMRPTVDEKILQWQRVRVEQVLYVLWDIGFKVGHATRSLPEVIEHSNEDFRTKTSMLEARLITGSQSLFDKMQQRFQRFCIHGRQQEYLEWRKRDQVDRHARHGGTVFVQEPQIKNGCGGLRDYQNMLWVASVAKNLHSTRELEEAEWLTLNERKQIDSAYSRLLRFRTAMHYQQGRLGDILTLKLQGEIANAMNYPQKNILRRTEALMREYYQSARSIFHICNLVARRLSGEEKPRPGGFWMFLPRSLLKDVTVDGFILRNGKLYFSSPKIFEEDPFRLLRVFHVLQQNDAELSSELESLIGSSLYLVTKRFMGHPEMREMFFSMLRKKGKVGRILRAMHQTGVLGRLVPEFDPLTCLVQHEFFHVYTADEHTIVCLEQLDRVIDNPEKPFIKYRDMFLACEMPEVLYMALILHDVGKASNSRSHDDVSAQLATRFAQRMKLPSRLAKNLVFLVDHHMTLMEIAQRRNLDEPSTICDFARIVQDQERLDMLMLMTFADAQGTGGNFNWSGWKELLVWQLYRATSTTLKGEEEFLKEAQLNREAIVEAVKKMMPSSIEESEVLTHFAMLPDRYVTSTAESLIAKHIELVYQFFIRQMEGVDVLRPVVFWEDKEHEGHSEVSLVTWDRNFLFSKIAGSFSLADLSILSADLFLREDNIIIATFCVCTRKMEAVRNQRDHEMFENYLAKSLIEEHFDFTQSLSEKKNRSNLPEGAEFPTVLSFDNDTSSEYTLLHVQTADRMGVLHYITSCLAELDVPISHARITTEKGAALDTFYLSDINGEKIKDEETQQTILQTLRNVLTEHPRTAKDLAVYNKKFKTS